MKKQQTAAQAYENHMSEVLRKLELLNKRISENKVDAENAHWGHVGSASHISELLDEIIEFIN